jgi:DNA modification methylase
MNYLYTGINMSKEELPEKNRKIGSLGINKIYCIDCLEGLRKLPDKSIDLAFIDPPYNVGKDYEVYKDDMPEEDYIEMIKNVISEFRRVTKKGFGIYTDWKHFQKFWQLVPEAEPIIIFKRSSGVVFSRLGIVQHHHVILTTAKCLNRKCKSLWDDIRVMGEGYLFREEKFGHPAQTSLKGAIRFIQNFSEKNDIILDCFIGVGTTAVASKMLGRNFIGFEINQKYIDISEKRLSQKNLLLEELNMKKLNNFLVKEK